MKRLILGAVLIAAAGLALFVALFPPAGLIPRVLGTGGYEQRIIRQAPHPYTFDRARYWDDRTDKPPPVKWGALILGPSSDDGRLLVSIAVAIGPSQQHDSENPMPGGPVSSIEDFMARVLPRERTPIKDGVTTVDGRVARDLVYDFPLYEPSAAYPPVTIPCRARDVFFEDRGYYYRLEYLARQNEYDRYSQVFDRTLDSFRFLD